jgi:hypothetical protein
LIGDPRRHGDRALPDDAGVEFTRRSDDGAEDKPNQ